LHRLGTRFLTRAGLRRNWLGSGILVLAGLVYLAAPHDLIPDAGAYGLTDDAAVLALCLMAAMYVAPDALRTLVRTQAVFRMRVLRADLGNFGLIQHRYVDGFLISGKNSGSHWIKYMLSLALAEKHGLAPPRFCSGRQADSIVGRADRGRCGRGFPQIATSHTIPSIAFSWTRLPRFVRQPPVVLLVRRIPDALCSGFQKWRGRYQVGLSDFVRGDPAGKTFIADIWWYIHFFNRWGALHRAQPDRVLLVRYEDVLADPLTELGRIANHLGLAFDHATLARAVALSGKDRMRAMQDPDAGETIVPQAGGVPVLRAEHWQSLQAVAARFLRHDLGYGAMAAGVPATDR
jgi:hypothetical protein